MIKLKIDVTKIAKQYIYEGKKGKYIDLALFDNKNGTDDFGNDGFVVQDIPKAARDAGEKGPIIGNWKHIGGPSKQRESSSNNQPAEDDIPW